MKACRTCRIAVGEAKHVIEAPADVPLAHAEALTPPGVVACAPASNATEGVDPAGSDPARRVPARSLGQEAAASSRSAGAAPGRCRAGSVEIAHAPAPDSRPAAASAPARTAPVELELVGNARVVALLPVAVGKVHVGHDEPAEARELQPPLVVEAVVAEADTRPRPARGARTTRRRCSPGARRPRSPSTSPADERRWVGAARSAREPPALRTRRRRGARGCDRTRCSRTPAGRRRSTTPPETAERSPGVLRLRGGGCQGRPEPGGRSDKRNGATRPPCATCVKLQVIATSRKSRQPRNGRLTRPRCPARAPRTPGGATFPRDRRGSPPAGAPRRRRADVPPSERRAGSLRASPSTEGTVTEGSTMSWMK